MNNIDQYLSSMSLGLSSFIAIIVMISPWIAKFKSLKAYQGKYANIFVLFSYLSCISAYLYSVNRPVYFLRLIDGQPYYLLIIGIVFLLIYVALGEFLNARNNRGVDGWKVFLLIIVFSSGITSTTSAAIAYGLSHDYYFIEGKIVGLRTGSGVSREVFAVTAAENVIDYTVSSKNGVFLFILDKKSDSMIRISVCSAEKPVVFRNLDLVDLPKIGDNAIDITSDPIRAPEGDEKCI